MNLRQIITVLCFISVGISLIQNKMLHNSVISADICKTIIDVEEETTIASKDISPFCCDLGEKENFIRNEWLPLNTSDKQAGRKHLSSPSITLHLIGERHSGTKWMTKHLNECFGKSIEVSPRLTRWKHWFQEELPGGQNKSVVVAQFRQVYNWVEAMRLKPYHSPMHFFKNWSDFVTTEWAMPRYGSDLGKNFSDSDFTKVHWTESPCQNKFPPNQIIPCLRPSQEENVAVKAPDGSTLEVKPVYELHRNGSGQRYESIIALRRAKIRNFLQVSKFRTVYSLEVVQYEKMAEKGTEPLIRRLEKVLGTKAACDPIPGSPRKNRPLTSDYVQWIRDHVDWETEALVGYGPDDL
jgi:hypothetical protein